jgi:hypothetical protein
MPVHIRETGITLYTYKELTSENILKETETYTKKMKEYEDAGKDEGMSAKEFYDYLGMDETWEEFVKETLIDGMVREKKLKTFHDITDGRMLYYLI